MKYEELAKIERGTPLKFRGITIVRFYDLNLIQSHGPSHSSSIWVLKINIDGEIVDWVRADELNLLTEVELENYIRSEKNTEIELKRLKSERIELDEKIKKLEKILAKN